MRGRTRYFGPWRHPIAALDRYVDEHDALHAGREPRTGPAAVTLDELVNRCLAAQRDRRDAAEISPRHCRDLKREGKPALRVPGRTRPAKPAPTAF